MRRSRWKNRDKRESVSSVLGAKVVRILVGHEHREFSVHQNLLSTASPYFADILSSIPTESEGIFTSGFFTSTASFRGSTMRGFGHPSNRDPPTVLLPAESAAMFELFVLWLYQRGVGLTHLVDEATSFGALADRPGGGGAKAVSGGCHAINLHHNLAKLHVFAAKAGIEELQDLALDCLQDVFFRCDWDVSPKFVQFVYAKCDPDHAFRLRKWAVAMMAWTLAMRDVDLEALCPELCRECQDEGDDNDDDDDDDDDNSHAHHRRDTRHFSMPPPSTSPFSEESKAIIPHSCPSSSHRQQPSPQPNPMPAIARRFSRLLASMPDLLADYSDHVSKLSRLKRSAALKNPSLRLPSNFLKSEDRRYGFRMCSFHTHRGTVGQGICPHLVAVRLPATARWSFYGGGGGGTFSGTNSFYGGPAAAAAAATATTAATGAGNRARNSSHRARFMESESDTASSSASETKAIGSGLMTSGPLVRFHGSDSDVD